MQVTLFRLAQELALNIVRHAGATQAALTALGIRAMFRLMGRPASFHMGDLGFLAKG